MGLITNMTAFLRRRYLKKHLSQASPFTREAVNFASSKSIGILFDATDLERRNEVLAYTQKLRETGKKVQLLGFFDSKQEAADFTFDYFNRTGVDWAKRPKSKAISFFLQEPYDVFIHFNLKPAAATEFIAALVRAHMKVGSAAGQIEHYNLMVDVKPEAGISGFIQQIEQLFKLTNVNHEAAKI